jgi:hypothetical protein
MNVHRLPVQWAVHSHLPCRAPHATATPKLDRDGWPSTASPVSINCGGATGHASLIPRHTPAAVHTSPTVQRLASSHAVPTLNGAAMHLPATRTHMLREHAVLRDAQSLSSSHSHCCVPTHTPSRHASLTVHVTHR